MVGTEPNHDGMKAKVDVLQVPLKSTMQSCGKYLPSFRLFQL